jgi:hypothetical protein
MRPVKKKVVQDPDTNATATLSPVIEWSLVE